MADTAESKVALRDVCGKFTNKSRRSDFFHSFRKNYVVDEVVVENSDQKDESDADWRRGRRIVELAVLANNMFCVSCKQPLHLSDIVSERRLGLGSVLQILCKFCNAVSPVDTGKRTLNGAFDINSKAAIGMIHCGLGPSHLSQFFMECNLPPVSDTTLKKKERQVAIGETLVNVAQESCTAAALEEKDLAQDKALQVSFDGGWQKRGTGWNYNSNTGHASMIGKESGKVISYAIRSKTCRVCSQVSTASTPHACPKNWSSSSKAMESDMAVSMAHHLHDDHDFNIDVIHADNDSATTAKLKQDFPNLEKTDDKNHTKNQFPNAYRYDLSKSHKELKPAEVIPYLTRCFMYARSESADEEELQSALDRIVPHVFGDHTLCSGVKWCSFKDHPSTFRFKSLSKGESLKSPDLKQDLEVVVQKYMRRARSLLELGSTQANESFNQMVSSKAPKARHYGGSSSLMNRVSATVLQKNEGHSYLTKVNKAALLSPGDFTVKLSKKIDKKRRQRRLVQQSKAFKKRRVQLKRQKSGQERQSTVKEGITYASGVELTANESDYERIPDPIKLENFTDYVTFDLETTGFGQSCDITQIAASVASSKFQCYVFPRCDISVDASKVTGISFCRGTNTLYLHGNEVQGKCIRTAFLDFLDFLKEKEKPILVGHNIASFDVPILSRLLKEFGLYKEFVRIVPAFLDTLKLARKHFPKEEVNGCFRQSNLVKKYLNVTYDAHNAVDDVDSLQQLFNAKLKAKCRDENMFSISCKSCKDSYTNVVQQKIISKAISEKLSKNGISMHHLQLVNRRDPNGLKSIMKENGIPSKQCQNLISKIQEE